MYCVIKVMLVVMQFLGVNQKCDPNSLNEHALFINEIFAGAKLPYKRGVARPV